MKNPKRINNAYFLNLLILILLSASVFTLPNSVVFSAAGDPPTISISSPVEQDQLNTSPVVVSGQYTDENVQQTSDLLFTAKDNGVIISDSDANSTDWGFQSIGTEKNWNFTKQFAEGSHSISIEIKEKPPAPDTMSATATVAFSINTSRPYITEMGIVLPDQTERLGEDLTSVPQDAKIKITVSDDQPMLKLKSMIESTTEPFNPIKVMLGTEQVAGTTTMKDLGTQDGRYVYDIIFSPQDTLTLKLNTTYLVYLDPNFVDDANNRVFSKLFKFTTKSDADPADNPHGHYALNTNMCAACHSTHLGSTNSLDGGSYQVRFNEELKADPSQNYCMACHDGTTNAPIIDKINSKYHHNNPIDYSNTGKNNLQQAESCTSCHNPHAEWSEQNQNLLKDHYVYTHKVEDRNKNGLTSLVVDSLDTTCDTCHNDNAIYDQKNYPGVYEVLAYNKASKAIGTITPIYTDKSPDVFRPTVPDYSLCLRCHNGTKKQADSSIADIESYYTDPSSAHNLTLPAGKQTHEDGSKLNGPIPCAECHDTHGSNNIKLLRSQLGNAETSDKFTMTGKTWTADYERQFCSKCHNSSTDIYGQTGKAIDPNLSEGHDPNTQKGKQACSTCHSNSYNPSKPDSIDKAYMEAAHAPKAGVERTAP